MHYGCPRRKRKTEAENLLDLVKEMDVQIQEQSTTTRKTQKESTTRKYNEVVKSQRQKQNIENSETKMTHHIQRRFRRLSVAFLTRTLQVTKE